MQARDGILIIFVELLSFISSRTHSIIIPKFGTFSWWFSPRLFSLGPHCCHLLIGSSLIFILVNACNHFRPFFFSRRSPTIDNGYVAGVLCVRYDQRIDPNSLPRPLFLFVLRRVQTYLITPVGIALASDVAAAREISNRCMGPRKVWNITDTPPPPFTRRTS